MNDEEYLTRLLTSLDHVQLSNFLMTLQKNYNEKSLDLNKIAN